MSSPFAVRGLQGPSTGLAAQQGQQETLPDFEKPVTGALRLTMPV
jgi:hypothetical protein